MAGIGSFLGGAAKGMEAQKALDLKSEEIANDKALRSRGLDIQQAQANFMRNEANQKALDATVQSIWQSMVNTHDRFADAGHAPQDAEPAIQSLSQHAVELLNLAGLKDKAAAFQEQTKALVSTPAKNTNPKYEIMGTDTNGKPIYGNTNRAAGPVPTPQDLTSAATDFLPKDENGVVLHGQAAFDKVMETNPQDAILIKTWIQGARPLPSQYQLARHPELKNALDIAYLVDPRLQQGTEPAHEQAIKEWNSRKPGSPGYGVTGAEGAALHFSEWTDAMSKLKNYDTGMGAGVTHKLNSIVNANMSQDRQNTVAQAESAANMYSPEVQKLLTNNNATGEERQSRVDQLMKTDAPPQELARIALSQARLMLEKSVSQLDAYHQTVSPLFDPGFFTPATLKAYDKIFADILTMDPSLKDKVEETKREFIPSEPVTQPNTLGTTVLPPGGGQLKPSVEPEAIQPPGTQGAVAGGVAGASAAASAAGQRAVAPQAPAQQGAAAPSPEEMQADFANMTAALAKVATLPPAQQAAAKLAILNALHAKYGTPTVPQQPSQGTMP